MMTQPVTRDFLYGLWHDTASANGGRGKISLDVRDTKFRTRPVRRLLAESKHDVWVWGNGRLHARIDLRSPDADTQLARFVLS